MNLSHKVTVFLISSGEPSLPEARSRLFSQTASFVLSEIRDVTPMHRAFQLMHHRAATEFFVQVDADMLLERDAIERLYDEMQRAPKNVAMYAGWLWGDAEEHPILGVKIYRTDIVKNFPYQDSFSCEMPQIKAMGDAGYPVYTQQCPNSRDRCYGLHYSLQSPEMAFSRWKRLTQKFRRYPWMGWVAKHPARLISRMDESEPMRAAALGAIAGLGGDLGDDTESDASKNKLDWRRIKSISSTGPKELVLYVTDACNHKCPFCYRTRAVQQHSDHMSPELVKASLEAFPSVTGVCVAGFGEPLLHPRLSEILQILLSRGIYVGLITNGSTLEHSLRFGKIPAGVGYINVSLNAATQEQHKKATGVDTWDNVIAGIKSAVSRKYECYVSYVCTQKNLDSVPAFLDLASDLCVDGVSLVNLLPHALPVPSLFWDSVLHGREWAQRVDDLRLLPNADIVKTWPVVIDGEPKRDCQSPFRMIGVDPRGNITGCRRVIKPNTNHGSVKWQDIWHSRHMTELRSEMLGDAPLRDECKMCWACWRDY
jgi:radical SAM protein with 4Fe4S-binding SPASM domain